LNSCSIPDTKSESAPSEKEIVEEVTEVKETEVVALETGTNGDSEQPKQENVEDGGNDSENNNQNFFSYEQLKTKSGSVVSGIDLKRREVSLGLHTLNVINMLMEVSKICIPT